MKNQENQKKKNRIVNKNFIKMFVFKMFVFKKI